MFFLGDHINFYLGSFLVWCACLGVIGLFSTLLKYSLDLIIGPVPQAPRVEPAVRLEPYYALSTAKRQSIHEMRSKVVARYVGRCSLTLAAGQLVRRGLGEEEGTGEEAPSQAREAAGPDEGAGIDQKENVITSMADTLMEEGAAETLPKDEAEAAATAAATIVSSSAAASITSPAESPVEEEADALPVAEEEEEESEYTHVRIPLPGYNRRSMQLQKKKAPAAETRGRHRGRGRLLPCLFPPWQVKEEGRGKTREGAPTDATEDVSRSHGASRDVPAFCAICLEAYAPGDVVAWSSNPACPHVYHRDCLVGWLGTLGRKMAWRRRFPDAASVSSVLDYGLACPCCRQDFIAKDLALEEEKEEVEGGVPQEENVGEESAVSCDTDGNV